MGPARWEGFLELRVLDGGQWRAQVSICPPPLNILLLLGTGALYNGAQLNLFMTLQVCRCIFWILHPIWKFLVFDFRELWWFFHCPVIICVYITFCLLFLMLILYNPKRFYLLHKSCWRQFPVKVHFSPIIDIYFLFCSKVILYRIKTSRKKNKISSKKLNVKDAQKTFGSKNINNFTDKFEYTNIIYIFFVI